MKVLIFLIDLCGFVYNECRTILRMKELDNQKLAIERGSNITVIMGSGVPLINTK